MSKRVAIIGAGVSGLPSIKHCLEEGLEPVCFEMRTDLGGLWNYVDQVTKGRSSVMKNTVTNTSKETYCYSDFPAPDDFPVYMPQQKMMEYVNLYAKRFQLENYIKFETEVISVRQVEDFESSGRWKVTVKNLKTGKLTTDIYDGVLICTGHHCTPVTPRIAGQDVFKGIQMHSNEYRNWKGFEDKRVIVVGLGNSAGDIGCELSRVCSQVFFSTREGAWVVARMAPNGNPFDLHYGRGFLGLLMRYLTPVMRQYFWASIINSRYCNEKFCVEPTFLTECKLPTVCDGLPNCLLTGKLKIRPAVQQLYEDSVLFTDGSVEENIDAVIYATGYTYSFPFIEHKAFEVVDNQAAMYKFVFPPDIHPSTIALIGFVETNGSILSVAEIQSRWATRVIKDVTKLPSSNAMRQEIETRNAMRSQVLPTTMKCGINYDWGTALDDVARELNCKPSIRSYLLTDTRLAWALFYGPRLPSHYRLCGPGSWPAARQTILRVWERVAIPLQGRKVEQGDWKKVGRMIRFVGLAVVLLLIFVFIL